MDMEDIELMGAVQLGDKVAFRRLWEKYYPPTYRAILQMVKNPDDARDIMQEAFLRVFRSAGKFDITRKFSSWFYTIVNHVYIDFFKKGKKNKTLFREETNQETENYRESIIDRVPSPKANPLEQTLQIEEKSQVWLAIEQLTFKHRQVIILCDIQGLSYDQIANHLGIPRGTVMSRLHNARDKLRKLLYEYVK
jgi:RNA polymerase sigma-70 factor (ECF subfamily)